MTPPRSGRTPAGTIKIITFQLGTIQQTLYQRIPNFGTASK
ncbi:hypothetical protein BACCAP_02097 [Pseudoflavonifractor capillosus ATCC 29799]|uniref:Uncharacterized protein n=1 Tax=Pseudoflavonifractor capillosus ATCC 29799 TaxID=411467 RepID=A6NV63_9FIRM|nr:hypothetical protein BACCAP_02097 [Pseudoflavonifractor capillosus ATCC 29799]